MSRAATHVERRDEDFSGLDLLRYYAKALVFTSRGRQVLILVFVLMTFADQHALMYGTSYQDLALPLVPWSARELSLIFSLVMGVVLSGAILYTMDFWRSEYGTLVDEGGDN